MSISSLGAHEERIMFTTDRRLARREFLKRTPTPISSAKWTLEGSTDRTTPFCFER